MIGTVRLGPEIKLALEMKGQVIHRTRTHLNVLVDDRRDLSVLFTRKLLVFSSRLYEMRSGYDDDVFE